MNLVPTAPKLVFVENRVVKREGKKDLNFVKLADPSTYENRTLMASSSCNLDFSPGEIIKPTFSLDEISGRSTLFLSQLTPVTK